MGPEDARLQDVRAWLSKAELDLKAAAHEISAPEEGLWGDVMFHSQQAAEKAMKAFLAWNDVPFRKTHSLEDLGQQCVAMDSTLGAVAGQAAPLTEYAWKFRYPGVSYFTYDGKSWYNALNAKVEKRFTHGYLLALTYTWSKFLAAISLLNAGDAAPAKYLSNQDYPHHVALTGIYELPVGRGRPFLSGLSQAPQAILGDWDLSCVYTYQSGPPITFGNVLLTGAAKDIPLAGSQRSAAEWFNTSVFNQVTAQQLANNLITLSPAFAGIRAAAYNSSDLSLLKHVQVHERLRLEIRVDSLNIFNQVSFGVPNTTPTSTSFGAVTTQKNVPRRFQGTLRLQF